MVQPKTEEVKTEEGKKKHTRTSRGRSKRGCYECRERHLKCDENFPSCDRCRNNGRKCIRPTTTTAGGGGGSSSSSKRSTTVIAPSSSSSPTFAPPKFSSSSISSLSSSLSPKSSVVVSNNTTMTAMAIIPISLGNPVDDPNGIFKWIGSPHITNMDTLIFWLTHKTDSSPEGFAGNLTPSWVNLIQQHRDTDPGVLGMFAVHALMVQGERTRTDSSTYLDRAERFMVLQAKGYEVVTSALLMIVLYLGSIKGNKGDLQSAEIHFKGLKALYNKDIKVNDLEWIFLWGTDITIATMLRRRPLLPWYIPPAFQDRILFSVEETSGLHRLAAKNAASVLRLLDDEFLSVSGILQDLHLIYKLRHSKILAETDPYIHAYTISLSWRANEFFLQSKSTADKTQLPADLCKQLLALALQSSTWHFTIPYISQDEVYVGEPESFPSILSVLRDCTREVLKDIGGTKSVVDTWLTLANLESFIWVSYIMALNLGANNAEGTLPWISMLYQAASLAGITTGDALQALLARWPCDVKQVDAIIDDFAQYISSSSSSTLVMPIR